MSRSAARRMTLAAGIAWLIVGVTGIIDGLVEYGDDWHMPYTVFMLALVVAATLSVVLGAEATRGCARPRLRMAGLAVSAVGAVAAVVVAWALPLWMTLLGAGFALLAAAADPAQRRPLALLAAGQLAAIAVLIVGIEAKVGRVDEYGDYPVAGGIAVLVVAAAAIVALVTLTFDRRAVTATPASA
jgi:uncharacterized membrane protein